jgi:Ulp1 family protease
VTIENIELKPADMFRLVPMVFLNDSTINYYLKVIQKYILSPAQTSECHFFNTYFFSKIRQEVANICMQQDVMLLSKHRAQLQTQMDPVNKKMRGWYKRIKLFQKKYLLLPVNKKDHWFAVVVANLPSLLQHFTQDLDLSTLPAELRPAILLLDPLVNVEESLELILRLFLETELKETLGPTYELKILQKEDPQDPDKSFLITDKNLPAYQLIVESFDLDTKTEEYL